MYKAEDINSHRAAKTYAVHQGHTVLQQVDRAGRIVFSRLPVSFVTRAEAKAHIDANKGVKYIILWGDR
jgi:hypothetical protein